MCTQDSHQNAQIDGDRFLAMQLLSRCHPGVLDPHHGARYSSRRNLKIGCLCCILRSEVLHLTLSRKETSLAPFLATLPTPASQRTIPKRPTPSNSQSEGNQKTMLSDRAYLMSQRGHQPTMLACVYGDRGTHCLFPFRNFKSDAHCEMSLTYSSR